jgi:hypothetical protein
MATSLLTRCVRANSGGADFLTVWHTVLKKDPLVVGIPRQRLEGATSLLAIQLITGQWIIYDSDLKQFSLEDLRRRYSLSLGEEPV